MKTSSYFGIVLGAVLLLTSCQEDANVKMHTIVHKDGWCDREISYSTIMSKEERDSMMQGEGAVLAQPIPSCLNQSAFMGTHTEMEGDTVTTTFSRGFHTPEDIISAGSIPNTPSLRYSTAWATPLRSLPRTMPTRTSSAIGSRVSRIWLKE